MKLLVLFLITISCLDATSQKVKYKDIYPQLASKNYEEGGPLLIQFLKDEKNQDHANANLQMSLWLEDRFMKYDVVDDSSRVYQVGDSAVFYFEKSKSL
ncbi:MAG: hypothetical protein AAFY41_18250, partial [Bacteroidota bacterium]